MLPENFQKTCHTAFPSSPFSTLSFYCYSWGRKDCLSLLLTFLVSCVISVLGKIKFCLPWKSDKCRSIRHLYLSTWLLELSHFTASSTVPDYLNTATKHN